MVAVATADKVIKPKVGLLELAKQLGNVSKACKIMGFSRDSFYRFSNSWMSSQDTPSTGRSNQRPSSLSSAGRLSLPIPSGRNQDGFFPNTTSHCRCVTSCLARRKGLSSD